MPEEAGDFARFAQEMQDAARRFTDAQKTLSGVEGKGEGADGMIQVVTDGNGGLVSLTLNPRIRRLDSETLADELTSAIKGAQEDARSKARLTAEETVGSDLWTDPGDSEGFRERVDRVHEQLVRSLEDHIAVIEGRLRGHSGE